MNDLKLSMKDIVDQSVEKLNEKLILLKKELFNLRFQKSLGELKSTHRFLFIRRTIARIKTELTKRSRVGE